MKRGEIWMADLGYTGKVRPVLVLSIDYTDDERAIVTYVPRTTSVWDKGRFDVEHHARGMKPGAFAVQLIGSLSNAKYMRRIGQVDEATLQKIEVSLKLWLGLEG
ncbi:MAG: type II toxin-antitoxin system PemK/MazF family toxin [Verrucomicrobia bacterium]|nr:type II toxin-antitoxin system PemK/MazF family toxin [Verrucomicrobiota bacterium]